MADVYGGLAVFFIFFYFFQFLYFEFLKDLLALTPSQLAWIDGRPSEVITVVYCLFRGCLSPFPCFPAISFAFIGVPSHLRTPRSQHHCAPQSLQLSAVAAPSPPKPDDCRSSTTRCKTSPPGGLGLELATKKAKSNAPGKGSTCRPPVAVVCPPNPLWHFPAHRPNGLVAHPKPFPTLDAHWPGLVPAVGGWGVPSNIPAPRK